MHWSVWAGAGAAVLLLVLFVRSRLRNRCRLYTPPLIEHAIRTLAEAEQNGSTPCESAQSMLPPEAKEAVGAAKEAHQLALGHLDVGLWEEARLALKRALFGTRGIVEQAPLSREAWALFAWIWSDVRRLPDSVAESDIDLEAWPLFANMAHGIAARLAAGTDADPDAHLSSIDSDIRPFLHLDEEYLGYDDIRYFFVPGAHINYYNLVRLRWTRGLVLGSGKRGGLHFVGDGMRVPGEAVVPVPVSETSRQLSGAASANAKCPSCGTTTRAGRDIFKGQKQCGCGELFSLLPGNPETPERFRLLQLVQPSHRTRSGILLFDCTELGADYGEAIRGRLAQFLPDGLGVIYAGDVSWKAVREMANEAACAMIAKRSMLDNPLEDPFAAQGTEAYAVALWFDWDHPDHFFRATHLRLDTEGNPGYLGCIAFQSDEVTAKPFFERVQERFSLMARRLR